MERQSDHKVILHGMVWPDSSLVAIAVDYDAVTLFIQEESGVKRVVRCLGYLGYQAAGFWDETIIEDAIVHRAHAFIDECEARVAAMPDSGCPARTRTSNWLLEVRFIDGCALLVCASAFQLQ